MTIRAYHTTQRRFKNICLIPASAHGTNPISCNGWNDNYRYKTMENGIDVEDAREKNTEIQRRIILFNGNLSICTWRI
jgi:glycine cleavage system protein P-like pyridoxal-binding family